MRSPSRRALLSLLPAVGAALVWGPVAVYFLSTGALVQAAGLIAWGVIAIGLVEDRKSVV